ncbi:sucrose transporter, putative [Talaromyces stipitatus ATCC 10500]|uniref:Sucrose transporter, putative n=1 Tax=Talaromyces stipitatus (strain ATCC 10500 / CBS 375.48 / QM 6759 / NRRL 1006) TaxID=441959 RepID=B8MBV2_TALSN|nr:sucrose transporter, putative [Talaromyces stipitatus ATCC 10500]EED18235.1 sucrose transporter, putative [Talaromyces stipitatus ATCC 10500]
MSNPDHHHHMTDANENSPLVMSPVKPSADLQRQGAAIEADALARARRRNELADQESKSTWYLVLLTLSIGGLQVVWSVELSNGSPFLLSLGMSKALLAIVWVAGPLTGTLVQPYIGILSDNCRIPWGKRKPFMIGGGLATIFCLMILAWVREIVTGVLGIFGADAQSNGVKVTTLVFATIMMFCLDFAINTVQAGIRAFIVDCAPAHQQEPANAWASRLTGAGNIIGYILGYMDLPKVFPIFGNTQFKILCLIASFSLGITLLISCLTIKERDPRVDGPPPPVGMGLISFFKGVWKSIRNLPPQIRKVCEVQLAAWIAWFPFLYYSTTYIGQLYVNPIFEKHRDLTDDEINRAWEDATRIGSFALLVNAIVSFTANIVLPLLIVPSYKQIQVSTDNIDFMPVAQDIDSAEEEIRRSISELQGHIASEPLLSHEAVSIESDEVDDAKKKRFDFVKKLRIPGLTLRRTWLLSLALLSVCMFSTFFITTAQAATVVIGIVGISWAVTLWAPFALISAEVAQRDAERRLNRLQAEFDALSGHEITHTAEIERNHEEEEEDEDEEEQDIEAAATIPKIDTDEASPTDQAGIVLGLHNVAVSFPQIFSTMISSLIFKALQKPRGEPWDDSVGWVMRFGGCAALVAALLARRLEEKGSNSR